ncbi:HEAT repeat domain-containing protein [Kitasatospora sp. NPDC056184]|uniref:HEAT repeat domain-containing protein n=1 Tax=Kitasatospora sp. NPDC056184 TaxID=3345738 RepID=UPI0035E1CCED
MVMNTAAALAHGTELLGSAEPAQRAAGCDLVGEAADRDEAVRAGAATVLLALAERERDGGVLARLAGALGRAGDGRAVPVLVALAGHPDAQVRGQVASALSLDEVVTGPPDAPGVRALLGLTRDADPEVRDWATFTLGFQCEADGPEVRAALWERTGDAYPAAREEGVHGLARRRDPRAVPLMRELLADPDGAAVLTFRAAEILGAPELLPLLEDYDPDDTGVADALAACDPSRRVRLEDGAWGLLGELERLRPDLAAAVWAARCEPGLTLAVGDAPDAPVYDVGALLDRAGGDPVRAAELVGSDHPMITRPSIGA